MDLNYEAIVLGLGGMGSAAAAQLAKRGIKTLGIEQFDFGHALGSSHGHTRLIRRAYFEHPDYVPLLRAAYEGWRELESAAGAELMVLNGLIMAGASDSALITGSVAAAKQHALTLEVLKPDDARARFPNFEFSDDMRVLFDPEGGFIHVERSVRAYLDAARRCGATLLDHTAVLSWSSDGRTVQVVTPAETFEADSLVVCAGAWSSRILRDMELRLEVERAVMNWFRPLELAYQLTDGVPCFAYETPYGFFYGMPQFDDTGVKVSEHRGLSPVPDPDTLDRTPAKNDIVPVLKFLPLYMPQLIPIPLDQRVCMYTMSPDSHFIVDTHPEFGNVHFAAGFSGHGFKFAPVIASILADLIQFGHTDHPAEFLQMKRFR